MAIRTAIPSPKDARVAFLLANEPNLEATRKKLVPLINAAAGSAFSYNEVIIPGLESVIIAEMEAAGWRLRGRSPYQFEPIQDNNVFMAALPSVLDPFAAKLRAPTQNVIEALQTAAEAIRPISSDTAKNYTKLASDLSEILRLSDPHPM